MRLQASFRLGRRKGLCWEKIWPPEPPGAAGRAQTDGEEVGRQHPHLCFPGAGSPSPRWPRWGGKDAKKCRNGLFFFNFSDGKNSQSCETRSGIAPKSKQSPGGKSCGSAASRVPRGSARGILGRDAPKGCHLESGFVGAGADGCFCGWFGAAVRRGHGGKSCSRFPVSTDLPFPWFSQDEVEMNVLNNN